MCLSSVSTRALVDILGTNHDAVVKEWVAALNAFTPTSQARKIFVIFYCISQFIVCVF